MTTDTKPAGSRNALLNTLSASFKVFKDCQPLALGIHKTIKERMPDIDMQQLRMAMRIHTASTRYLKTLSQAELRFDLDGNQSGEVTPEQRRQASDTLLERFRKKAQQHKAEAQAKQQAEKQAQAEKQRQDKLHKLAAKFNAR